MERSVAKKVCNNNSLDDCVVDSNSLERRANFGQKIAEQVEDPVQDQEVEEFARNQMSQVTYRRRAHTIACRVVCVTSFFWGVLLTSWVSVVVLVLPNICSSSWTVFEG